MDTPPYFPDRFAPRIDLPAPSAPVKPAPKASDPWSFFHPAWEEDFASDVESVWEGSPTPTPEDLRYLLNDPHAKLEPEMRVPATQRERVLFWVEVYTLFSSHMKVLHDRNQLGLVYGYVDFTQLLRAERPSLTLERKMRRIEREIKLILKAKITAALSLGGSVSSERFQIRAYLARHGVRRMADWRARAKQIRSQSGQSDMFRLALWRSQDLLPQMEQVFRDHGLPVGLARIPFVESSFNRKAHSKAGARGIWQFTPCAAREFMGRRNRKRWSDPILQTEGAARMLKRYRTVFPDWGSTVLSYNSGIGRVQRLVARYRARRIEDLVRKGRPGLGFAGQNYYAELLAANFIETYKTEIFSPGLFDEPAATNVADGSDAACTVSQAR
jgi:membrane-bound lytic murein transglycosylase D